MTALLSYLEAAKVEALADEYRGAGYEVIQKSPNGSNGFDLLVHKGERTIAIEVKARDALGASLADIRRHRELARQAGYEYHLTLVNPPRERKISVAGLGKALLAYLTERSFPGLDQIALHTTLDDVDVYDINAIDVTPDGVRVAGAATIEASLEYSGGRPDNGISLEAEFPLNFDVVLDGRLQVKEARTLDIDLSDYIE
jgi:hypothetical protein